MIFIGYWQPGIPTADDVFPELRKMCECDMEDWTQANLDKLDECYVNRVYMLEKIPADRLMVISKDGSRMRLIDHPMWATWAKEMSPGEIYSHLSLRSAPRRTGDK